MWPDDSGSWSFNPFTVDQSTLTPPPAIVSNAGDAMTQSQTGVSQGWGWLNDTLKQTVNAVAQIGVAKWAAGNGVGLSTTQPVQVQDPRTGALMTATYTGAGQQQQQQGSGLMTLALVAGVIWLATRK